MTAQPVAPSASAPRGALPWGLGLLSLILIPFLNLVVSGVAMLAAGLYGRRHGGLARSNSVAAANWGLTVLLVDAACIVVWVIALSIQAQGFFPWGLTLIVWAVLGLANLIASIIGLTGALSSGEVRWPAIRFFR